MKIKTVGLWVLALIVAAATCALQPQAVPVMIGTLACGAILDAAANFGWSGGNLPNETTANRRQSA